MPGQLRMLRAHYERLPDIALPAGHRLRTYLPGDEAHWARIVNSVESLGAWDVERVERELTRAPKFDPEGLFFVEAQGVPVATACAWRESLENTDVGQLHMVAVDPAHRGKSLGKWASAAVLRHFERRGFGRVYLLTDDFRLPAVKTYLDMGFEPLYPEPDHRERWEQLFDRLGYPKP